MTVDDASEALRRAWDAFEELIVRAQELERIADRLAATCADPLACEDYLRWKERGTL